MQIFAAVRASVCNRFNSERCLASRRNFKLNRTAALAEWRGLCAAQEEAILPLERLVRIALAAPVVAIFRGVFWLLVMDVILVAMICAYPELVLTRPQMFG